MKAPAAVLLVGCSQPGLLLDVVPADHSVATVEVFVPDQAAGDALGMPPANSAKTPGTVYAVTDRLTASIDSSHHARLLLQVDAETTVPALLVVGYDANHDAIEQAVLPGPVTVRHTQSDRIVIHLDPVTQVAVASALDPNGPSGPRLARWSARALDDHSADCIAVLTAGGSDYEAAFFSKHDDLDCDGADPECDDTAYLVTEPAGSNVGAVCATPKPVATNGACRLGKSVACEDNVGDCDTSAGTLCVPKTVCDHCDAIDTTCTVAAIADPTLLRLHCAMTVVTDTTGVPSAVCSNGSASSIVDLSAHFGSGWVCGTAGFTVLPNLSGPMTAIPLTSTNFQLAVACKTQALTFTLVPPTTTAFDHTLMSTSGAVLIPTSDGTARDAIAIPFVAEWTIVTACPMQSPEISCVLQPDASSDPIWHCAGGN
jgi:hypothetical protein